MREGAVEHLHRRTLLSKCKSGREGRIGERDVEMSM